MRILDITFAFTLGFLFTTIVITQPGAYWKAALVLVLGRIVWQLLRWKRDDNAV